MNSVTPEPIMRIAMGFMAAKHLFTASAIGLFEALAAGPASLEEIARKTDVPPRTLGIIAAAMVSLGMIERQGNRYQNGAAAAAFLAGAGGPDMRPMLRFWNHISYPTWEKLEEAVRTGHGQAKFGGFSEQQQQIFSQGVESFSAGTAAALAKAYDFDRHQRVLDVGGGTGSFLLAILQHNKNSHWHAVRAARSLRGRTPTLGKDARGVTDQCRRGKFFHGPASWRSRCVGRRKYRSCPLRCAQYCADEIDARPGEGGCTASTGRSVDRFHLYRASCSIAYVRRVSCYLGRGTGLQRARCRRVAAADRLAKSRAQITHWAGQSDRGGSGVIAVGLCWHEAECHQGGKVAKGLGCVKAR